MVSKQLNVPPKGARQPRRRSVAGDEPQVQILKLPLEIRLRIWKLVLVFEEPIFVKHHARQIQHEPSFLRSGKQVKLDILSQEQRKLSSQFALPSTCRQVYLEAAPVYYGLNTFELSPSSLVAFAESISAANIKSINSIHWGEHLGVLACNIKQFECLRRLVLVARCLADIFNDPYDLFYIEEIRRLKPSLKIVIPPVHELSCLICKRAYETDERFKKIRYVESCNSEGGARTKTDHTCTEAGNLRTAWISQYLPPPWVEFNPTYSSDCRMGSSRNLWPPKINLAQVFRDEVSPQFEPISRSLPHTHNTLYTSGSVFRRKASILWHLQVPP